MLGFGGDSVPVFFVGTPPSPTFRPDSYAKGSMGFSVEPLVAMGKSEYAVNIEIIREFSAKHFGAVNKNYDPLDMSGIKSYVTGAALAVKPSAKKQDYDPFDFAALRTLGSKIKVPVDEFEFEDDYYDGDDNYEEDIDDDSHCITSLEDRIAQLEEENAELQCSVEYLEDELSGWEDS